VQLLRAAAAESLRAGADELFATAQPIGPSGDLIGGASAGASFRLPVERVPITVGYGIDQHLGSLPRGTPDQTHHFAAGVETACRCAGFQLTLDLPSGNGTRPTPIVRFVLDLKQLGSFGSP
jgi:hypothetical protein